MRDSKRFFALANHQQIATPQVTLGALFISGNDIADNLTMNVSESEVSAGVPKRKSRVIDAKLVQDCGMQVMHVNSVFDGVHAELIRAAIHAAALDYTARHKHGKAGVMVITACLS